MQRSHRHAGPLLIYQLAFHLNPPVHSKPAKGQLIKRTPRNPYVRLDADGGSSHQVKIIESLDGLVEGFERVRNRIGLFMGSERRNVGDLAGRILNVIDIEATAGPSESEGRLAMPDDRTRDAIDLVAVAPDGEIWCFEAKLLSNKELRASGNSTPAVVEQIRRYSRMLGNRREAMLKAYQNVAKIYDSLDGQAFVERRKYFSPVKGLKGPRDKLVLIIFDYDRDQQQGQLPLVLQKLPKDLECVCMGNCRGITAAHLFRTK